MVATLSIIVILLLVYAGHSINEYLKKRDLYNFVSERRKNKHASKNDSNT